MGEWIAAELWNDSAAQLVVLLMGVLAVAGAVRFERKALAIIGVVAPLLALALSFAGLAHSYEQIRILAEFAPSTEPLPPPDQRSTVIGSLYSVAPVILAPCIAVILPIAAWTCVRVYRLELQLQAVVIAATGVLAVALWGASWWASDLIYFQGFLNVACDGPVGWYETEVSAVMLERLRALVIVCGVLLGAGAIAVAVRQARRGVTLGVRAWAALGVLLGVALAATLWTADERHDTRDYFRVQPRGHAGFVYFRGPVADPEWGPTLEHCSFDWPGGYLISVDEDPQIQSIEDLEYSVERLDWCGDATGLDVILAQPAVPIGRIAPILRSARAQGLHRWGVAALRPKPVTRATLGEFVTLRSCVVEFTLDPEGVALDQFATWGDLARAADAAQGTLVIAPPSEPR